jgi:hypothetical protein
MILSNWSAGGYGLAQAAGQILLSKRHAVVDDFAHIYEQMESVFHHAVTLNCHETRLPHDA